MFPRDKPGRLREMREAVENPDNFRITLNPAIGTADYADDTDGQALAGDCDHPGSVSNGGENGGCKFLNP